MRPPKSPIGFYAAALEAGGNDNGPPGIREHYGSNYYSAFVFDPDGNNIEARRPMRATQTYYLLLTLRTFPHAGQLKVSMISLTSGVT